MVSVVVVTRNRRHLLPLAIRAATEQHGVGTEVVVVDNGSEDGTAEYLTSIAASGLRVVTHQRAVALSVARNSGIALARGGWLAFLDDDDVWSPYKLSRQLAAAADADAGWCFSGAVAVTESMDPIKILPLPPAQGIAERLLVRDVMPAGASNVVARRDIVLHLGGFDEDLAHLDDWDLWVRLARASPAASVVDPLVGYVQHPRNRIVSSPSGVIDEYRSFVAKHAAACELAGVSVDEPRFLDWVAGGHRRAGRRTEAARMYLRRARLTRDARDLARAAGAVLGERVMDLGRQAGRRGARSTAVHGRDDLAWLTAYR